ncbi:unnamed protein product [Caenorhabditis sp. 36 PRJEB53466]|nr:unnamed protein product [Caenorhabditis sp. 36 PRJEB53466]
MVLPKKRKSMLSQEERISRLKESRLKYSHLGKPKNTSLSLSRPDPLSSSTSTIPTASRPLLKPTVPRNSINPRCALPRPSIAPIVTKKLNSRDADIDFEVDPSSMAMIQSGRVTIPMNRPSISASRHTIGSRQSFVGRQFSRFRASIAQEPRVSLLPLGINVFEANATQRSEVSEFLSNMLPGTTPAKPNTATNSAASTSVFNGLLNSTRQRKIRFMDSAIQEVRESAESAEVAAVSTSVHHSPTCDTSFMPTSILSTKKKDRKTECPVRTPRKRITFDDEEEEEADGKGEDRTARQTETVSKDVLKMEKAVASLSNRKLNESETIRVKSAIEKLRNTLEHQENAKEDKEELEEEFKSPERKRAPSASIPITPLRNILNSIVIEEYPDVEEREVEERKNKKRRSSKMKVGRRSSRSGKKTQESEYID